MLIGAAGEAFARDQHEHYQMGFRRPPESEISSWTSDPEKRSHKRSAPVNLQRGDRLGCLYTTSGHIELWHNSKRILKFNVQRPVATDTDYYAVVDVCFTAYSLTILPQSSFSEVLNSEETQVPRGRTMSAPGGTMSEAVVKSSLCNWTSSRLSDIDGKVREVVRDCFIQNAIRNAVLKCDYSVTIADPGSQEIPLIAVSEAFEKMTGFSRREILGVNCRFLNQGSPVSSMDIMGLRIASQTGAPFTALLPNRKKNGDMFINMLDLRGLIVAQEPSTGELLWYLVGIQADVTDLDCNSEDHFIALQEMALLIREQVKFDLASMVSHSAGEFNHEAKLPQTPSTSFSSGDPDVSGLTTRDIRSFQLLKEPVWMTVAEGEGSHPCQAPPESIDGGTGSWPQNGRHHRGKLKATMPPEALHGMLRSGCACESEKLRSLRSSNLKCFIQAYANETKTKSSVPCQGCEFCRSSQSWARWTLRIIGASFLVDALEEWKTSLRADSARRCYFCYASTGIAAVFLVGIAIGRSLHSPGSGLMNWSFFTCLFSQGRVLAIMES